MLVELRIFSYPSVFFTQLRGCNFVTFFGPTKNYNYRQFDDTRFDTMPGYDRQKDGRTAVQRNLYKSQPRCASVRNWKKTCVSPYHTEII